MTSHQTMFLYFILVFCESIATIFVFNFMHLSCVLQKKWIDFYASLNLFYPDGVSLDLDLIPGILRSWARALRTQIAWCTSPRVVWEPPGTRATTPGQCNSNTYTPEVWCLWLRANKVTLCLSSIFYKDSTSDAIMTEI